MSMVEVLRHHARAIWDAAVEAVRPAPLVRDALVDLDLGAAPRLLVLGAGKAGAAMAEAVESALVDRLDRIEGIVNVPADAVKPLKKIRLNAARPAATNFPTAEGVAGAEEMLKLARGAGPNDVALCLLSGGGSALLPAPADGVPLADKLAITLSTVCWYLHEIYKKLHVQSRVQAVNKLRQSSSRPAAQ